MSSRSATVPSTLERLTEVRDEELVERALGGDRWAEEALFRRHVLRLGRIATRLVGSRAEADDVLQDAFVDALEELSRLRDPAAFGAWLTQITVHKAHRRLRRRALLRRLGLSPGEPEGLAGQAAAGAPPGARAELRLLDEALRRLPGRVRTAWILRHVEQLGVAEVADACGCAPATVKRWLARAEKTVERHTRRSGHG